MLSDSKRILESDDIYRYISHKRLERINNLKYVLDKKVLLYTELMLKKIVCEQCGLGIDGIDIRYSCYGKPYIANLSGFEFSISHTKSTIVIAVNDFSVGVDIESLDISPNYICISDGFSSSEQKYINENSDCSIERLIEIWTKKESYLKALGVGLYHSLSSFSVLEKIFFTFRCGDELIAVYSDDFESLCDVEKIIMTEQSIIEYFLASRVLKYTADFIPSVYKETLRV